VPQDKRQLAQLVAAGIGSTALVFGLAVAPAPGNAPLPATSLRVQAATTPTAPSPAWPAQIAARPASARSATRPSASRVHAIPARALSTSVVPLMASANGGEPDTAKASRRGGIADLLLGDGRYGIRPFPSPVRRN